MAALGATRFATLTLVVSAGILCACIGSPARRSPEWSVDLPASWSAPSAATTGAPPDVAWWRSLNDAHLDAIVTLALEHNYDLRTAAARVERAAAEARMAGAEPLPTVRGTLDAARQRQNYIGLPIPGSTDGVLSSTSTRFGVSLAVSWEVDLWGRLRGASRAAVADAEGSVAAHGAARLSLAAQAVKAWLAVVEARQQLALAEATVRSFEDSAGQVRARFEQGLRPAVDLRLALSSLADARALGDARRERLDAAVRQTEVLIGRYPSGRLLDNWSTERLPPQPAAVPAGLPAQLIGRRPDLIAAERRVAAAGERYRAARAALYPRLSLTAGGGRASEALNDLLDGDFRVWNLAGNLLQPLFEGGRLRAAVARATAIEDEALAAWAQAALEAFAEVEIALAAESLLAGREEQVGATVQHLAAAREQALTRYRSGVGDYLTVLESQSRALAAESALIEVRHRRLTNRVDLHLALGGDFEVEEPSS